MTHSSDYFPATYHESRSRFAREAGRLGAQTASYPIQAKGREGEDLATDIALLAAPDAQRLLIMTSATHGVEGFCGAGCQFALMDDAPMLKRARDAGVALLLVHAVNPYGFSWLARTEEGNVDLNRNAPPFGTQAPPQNPGYAELHPLLLPAEWPPDEANQRAIEAYIAKHGLAAFAQSVSRGQYTHADGLFYGGTAATASLQNLRQILRTHASSYAHIGWIDVHTGLGPRGHGEKIFAGRRDDGEVARARQWWGPDVAVPFQGSSASVDITGQLASLIYQACPRSEPTLMALEYGTVPFQEVVQALRGRNWLRAHPEAPAALQQRILQATRDAFYCDQPDWHGSVLGQSRVAVLQALFGLQAQASVRR